MKRLAGITAAIVLVATGGCATTTLNGVPVQTQRNVAITIIGVTAAALILSAESEQDAESLDQGIPERGCDACTVERLPGPVPRD